MSRLIDADALWMDIIHAMDYCDDILEFIEQQPTVEQKTGKWIVWGGMDVPENHGRHKCSECGEFALLRYEKPLRKEVLSDFCPNCGAKMKGEEDE